MDSSPPMRGLKPFPRERARSLILYHREEAFVNKPELRKASLRHCLIFLIQFRRPTIKISPLTDKKQFATISAGENSVGLSSHVKNKQ